ncbi:hypothetical protein DDE18_14215 [Nocardioides gansuensis]|uniref:Uncharacterized protein n=1 Tax=Nocardioides gansuensis TaxID=2138300 RepID=A0A2T8F828_9ACTN|nr:hypothetical protein [Nocardioides gansuensis]PVG81872.1 hypothetical protein DDE18_14215 [Nocardioides gansuensis]
MSWIALLLIGVAVADLAHSVWPVRVVPECVGAIAAVLVGLLAGLTSGVDVAALVVIAAVVVAWGQTVTRGFGGRGPVWVPLLLLGVALAVAIGVSGEASPAGGWVGRWLDGAALPVVSSLTADRALLLLGAFLVQMSTGNVLVRLVLAATGTVNPARHGRPDDPEMQLKGGRLLGPMERVFLLSLGLAGHVTAASIVVAAKGLLRFPELSSRRDQERIHQLTEYFLVGSFVSWMVALVSLVLLAR